MNKLSYPFGQIIFRFLSIVSIVSVLASCQLLPSAQTETPVNATLSETMPTQESITPVLPGTFQTSLLNPLDKPHTYINETCRYLRNKWNPSNAEPGTVVMVLLIKNVNRGTAELPDSISVGELITLMNQLREQGFEAINTKQLQAFVERNVRIPPRSVLIIQDGNHNAEYFDKVFREYWENWGWTIVNGWVSGPDLPESLIQENIELEREGFVDHQARGAFPDTKLSDESAKNVIARELQGSLNGFESYFAKNPVAFIWPNGGFGVRPVEAARQLRFRLGFTSNTRGPIMYNWVPLANEVDPLRPDFPPEGRVNVPPMTLPTYSPNEALMAIDMVRAIGKEAATYAQNNKEIEHEYYEIVCAEEYGPMPTP